jgi:DNA anti-recombination protein RmuC
MDISSILKNLDQNVLTEETASAIAEAFETAVNEKVSAKLTLELESALLKQDKEHADKLRNLIEAIDLDHTNKLKDVVDAINENHTAKLEQISGMYRKALNEKAESFSNSLIGEMSNYLDLYLEKNLPTTQLEEAVANTYAKVQLEKIKGILKFDPETINENVKEVLEKGNTQIKELEEKLNESHNENTKLAAEIEGVKAALLLEKKTRGFSFGKKEYLTKILCDKTPTYIEENFKYVVEMFEKDDSEEREVLAEQAKKTSISKDVKVPTALVNEAVVEENSDYAHVTGYLTELKRS